MRRQKSRKHIFDNCVGRNAASNATPTEESLTIFSANLLILLFLEALPPKSCCLLWCRRSRCWCWWWCWCWRCCCCCCCWRCCCCCCCCCCWNGFGISGGGVEDICIDKESLWPPPRRWLLLRWWLLRCWWWWWLLSLDFLSAWGGAGCGRTRGRRWYWFSTRNDVVFFVWIEGHVPIVKLILVRGISVNWPK